MAEADNIAVYSRLNVYKMDKSKTRQSKKAQKAHQRIYCHIISININMFRLTLLAIALAAASAGTFVEDHAEQIAKWQDFKMVRRHV